MWVMWGFSKAVIPVLQSNDGEFSNLVPSLAASSGAGGARGVKSSGGRQGRIQRDGEHSAKFTAPGGIRPCLVCGKVFGLMFASSTYCWEHHQLIFTAYFTNINKRQHEDRKSVVLSLICL